MSFSGLGIGLSVVFGCLLLALISQLYYLLWWKKRRSEAAIGNEKESKGMLHGLSLHSQTKILESDVELGASVTTNNSKDVLLKAFGDESVESELMRLHNLAGPPRFLFTIKEETKEDLESEDGKSRKGSRARSLSDVMLAIDTPFLTPLPSSPLKSPSNPLDSSYKHQGFNFNPLFESFSESEVNRLRSSPPPKFKFLRDAEEKLYRRMMEEAQKKAQNSELSPKSTTVCTDERDGSFLRLIKNKDRDQRSSSQSTAEWVIYWAWRNYEWAKSMDLARPACELLLFFVDSEHHGFGCCQATGST
ncbi:uncharacterized protein G2W53_037632 [Senna tora]|uniref:Uncharacterized protein n=1 Tax=Senna tora TaxID=362788 RepID=A0A834SKT2_9FABA|nr:uncharacterized protein G2W53_037632 [Senna tora]